MKKPYASVAAIALAVICYFPARVAKLSEPEAKALAARFHFEKVALPEVPDHLPYKNVRQVHPSLERICAWVSSMGASATLVDLDGDGLANDLIWVEPRTDLVTVLPVPGTGDRYKAFTFNCAFWAHNSYDLAALAPMGSIAGDFNEDGLMDVMVYFWGRTPVIYLHKAASKLEVAGFEPVELVDSGERWFSNAAIQADLDGDGHIDLMIGNYFQDGSRVLDRKATGIQVMHEGKSKALNGGYKHVFLWQRGVGGASPQVQYREVTHLFSEEIARGWTLALGAADPMAICFRRFT